MVPVTLSGSPGSPYTRKMLALLRYRRIPYRFVRRGIGQPKGLPQAKVDLLPTFCLPNDTGEIEAVVDSTPIIRRRELGPALKRYENISIPCGLSLQ